MIEQSQIDTAKAALTEAFAKFERAKAELYTFDRRPIADPATTEKKLAKLREPVREAVEQAIALADEATAQVEAERLAPAACPTSELNAAELEAAGALAVFVREDAAELPVADLAARLQWVSASGSKAQKWTYARYAKQRFQREQASTTPVLGLDLLGAELKSIGAIGPRQGLSSEAQRLSEQAAALRRFARAQLAGDASKGTGRPMGL